MFYGFATLLFFILIGLGICCCGTTIGMFSTTSIVFMLFLNKKCKRKVN